MFDVLSFGLDTNLQSFVPLSIIRCSKSAEKFAVRVRRVYQVATVVMETMHIASSKPILKKKLLSRTIENGITSFSTNNKYSKCCELV